jgi:hypothetical protein
MSTNTVPVFSEHSQIDYNYVREVLKKRLSIPSNAHTWNPEELAERLRVSKFWVYNRTKKNAENPPPRINRHRLYFNLDSLEFLRWLAGELGIPVDDLFVTGELASLNLENHRY